MGEPLQDDPDIQAVEACRTGNANEFARLVEKYKDRIYGLALRMTGNPWDAEDLSQEAFLRAYRNLAAFDVTRKFSIWLYTIALNLGRDRARHRKRECVWPPWRQDRDEPPPEIPSAEPDPAQRAAAREDVDVLQTCLMALTRGDRELILLQSQLELPHETIARMLGIRVNTVKVRLHRARERLKERYRKARTT